MKLFSTYLIICFILIKQNSLAQNKDTLYYFVNTSKTPKMDRMVEVGTEVYHNLRHPLHFDTIKYVKIICPCLPYQYYPSLTASVENTRTIINRHELKKINFVSLSTLLAVILKDYKQGFNNKHVVMIVQHINKKYLQFKTLLTEYSDPSNDYEIIKAQPKQ